MGGIVGDMDMPTELQTLGVAFLAVLADRLGHQGAAAVLLLLVAQTKTAGACDGPSRPALIGSQQ